MTITLTIEEVKNYVSAMEYWQSRRAVAVVDAIAKSRHYPGEISYINETKMRMAEWDLANPMPTLLSTHFGALVPKVTVQQDKQQISKG